MIARVSVSDRLIHRRHQKYFLRGYTPSSHAERGSTSLMPGTFQGQSWSSNPPFSPCPRSRHVLNTRNPTQPFTREIANLSSVDALRTSVDTVRRRRGRTGAVALAVGKCINGRRTDGRTDARGTCIHNDACETTAGARQPATAASTHATRSPHCN